MPVYTRIGAQDKKHQAAVLLPTAAGAVPDFKFSKCPCRFSIQESAVGMKV